MVTGALGLKGEVRVKTFTDDPKGLARYGTLHTDDGRAFQVAALRSGKKGEAVIAFKDITGRTAAEALKGVQLFVPRDALPATQEDEFYYADLIGLVAYDSEGRLVGKVSAIDNFGAGDVIELTRDGDDTVCLAFTKDTVPAIDVAGGRITVAVPQDDENEGPHPHGE